ncbi:MAG: YggS family pyridoxal phosphate-dependent enzyme [Salinibacter sp.]|uniref:YggS family pyridoxal phosphate-dependent enzyme n=1 Tax=Salinibacter sp. TaxID=2065818 RepID=UPI002FC2E5F9
MSKIPDATPEVEAQIQPDAVHERVQSIQARIAQACERAGRSPNEITVVAVSKTFPMQAIASGTGAGLKHFGENRARQLRDKAKARPGAFEGGDIKWHMVGHLQTNKAKFIARHADWFDALDSPRLAEELDKRAAKNDRTIPCLVQVNITGDEQKYGLDPSETHDYLDHCAQYDHLAIRGLMALGSFVDDPEEVRGEFQKMRTLFDTYDASDNPQVEMAELSIGMSNDFEVAIEEGSTMIRLGTSIFGPRDYE